MPLKGRYYSTLACAGGERDLLKVLPIRKKVQCSRLLCLAFPTRKAVSHHTDEGRIEALREEFGWSATHTEKGTKKAIGN